MKRYWIVNHINGACPRCIHETMESAIAVAKRLASENPGRVFVVLETVSAWTTPKNIEEVEIEN